MTMETDAFRDLVEKCLEGTATSEEQRRAVAAAEASAQLRAELVEALDLDARIRTTRHVAEELVAATMDALLRRGSSARFARRVSEQIERAGGRVRRGPAARSARRRAASRWTALAASAAAVVLAGVGIGMMRGGPGEAPSADLVAARGRVLQERGDPSTHVSAGADIFPEDRLETAEGAGAVLQHVRGPTRTEPPENADIGTFDRDAVSREADLPVESIRGERRLLDLDFEDGKLPVKSFGTVVEGPRATTGRLCLAGVRRERGRVFRVQIENADTFLLTYRRGAVLSFDYWVREQTGAIDVYFWNDTRRRSPGFTIWKPVQERWTRATLRLSEFDKESHDGDLILNLTIQTTRGGNELFVDNIRVDVED